MEEKKITLFGVIKSLLLQEPEFQGFVYRKRGNRFSLKFNGGSFYIELGMQQWDSVWSLHIWGSISVRYDICFKWFEKFCVRTLQDQRDTSLLGESFDMAGLDYSYVVHNDKELFDNDYFVFKSALVYLMKNFIPKYSSLTKIYNERVLPIIKGEKSDFRNLGVEEEFEYLTICRIIAPGNYEILKQKAQDSFRLKYQRKEVNYMRYHDRIPEIFEYLESLDLEAMMHKKGWTKGEVISLAQFE